MVPFPHPWDGFLRAGITTTKEQLPLHQPGKMFRRKHVLPGSIGWLVGWLAGWFVVDEGLHTQLSITYVNIL